MKLTITNFDPYNKEKWLFKLKDDNNIEHLIMHEIYYKIRNMKSPINKWLLDQTNGVIIDANTEEIDSLNIVTSVR